MNKKIGRKCPYCKKKVSLFYAASHMRDGEYTCNECKKYSNVKFNPLVYLFLIIAAVLGAIFGLVLFKDSIKGIVMSAVPFLCLYLILPLFYMLVPIKVKSKTNTDGLNNKKRENVQNSEQAVKQYNPKTKRTEQKDNDSFYDDGTDDKTKYIPNIK